MINNGNIEKISKIDSFKLKEESYFKSLLEQGYAQGMLDDCELEIIQGDCLSILADKSRNYNGGESSSIRVEAAKNIMESVMFTMGMALKAYSSPDDAVEALKRKKTKAIFLEGQKRIDKMIMITKMIHGRIIHNLLDTPNVFYKSTIVDGVEEFFKLYYPSYAATEIHITADYPTFNSVGKLEGIEFIHKYLENIYCENQFCVCFTAENIHYLLLGVDENYQVLLFNIYEYVLTTALGCGIVGKDVRKLELLNDDILHLKNIFKDKKAIEIEAILSESMKIVIASVTVLEDTSSYLHRSLHAIASTIEKAMDMDKLNVVFNEPVLFENKYTIEFSYGEKMDDNLYKNIVAEILQCRNPEDKIQIIKESIHSFADFEDILLDSEFSAGEVYDVLKLLSSEEFIVLLKKYPYQSGLDELDINESEKILRNCLNSIFLSLTDRQQIVIQKAMKQINL